MIPTNPYIAGDPVSGGERFIGRTDVLRDVLRILRNPNANALVLYGQRRIGKTSILLQLQQQLAAKNDYIPVYFDLQDKAALPLAEVLYQLAQRIAAVVGLEAPIRKEFGRAGQFFRETFLPQAAEKAGEPSLVLLFDEFDVLDMPKKGQAGESFFPYLRGWMSEAAGVQFIFVMGRRPDDLSTDTLAAFKQVGRRHVSLMSREDSLAIIRQSEKTDSLTWHDKAAERVWHWTQGHPYLTQLLCSEVWETAYDDEPETPPEASIETVDEAVPDALERGAHAFLWIWDGLPPAERIVMAAMADVNKPVIGRDELAHILNRSGVRLILRELDLAPETLVQWDLLRPVDGDYRFAVPLLKQWVIENKPLQRVKQELDDIEPLAQNLFKAAQGFYNQGKLKDAHDQLMSVLDINPNHMQARLFLGRVYLGQGDPETAVSELEPVYKYDPSLGQQDLIGALLALAKSQTDGEAQLTTYERVLNIDSQQVAAKREKETIWRKRAEAALNQQDFATAQHAYQQIGDTAGLERIRQAKRKVVLATQLDKAAKHEQAEAWTAAISIYKKLLAEFPDKAYWQTRLDHARQQADLLQTYNEALSLHQQGENQQAQTHLLKIIAQEPDYKESLRYLLLITKNVDTVALEDQIAQLQQTLDQTTTEHKAERTELKEQVAQLQQTLDQATADHKAERAKFKEQIDDLQNSRVEAPIENPEPAPSQPKTTSAQSKIRPLRLWNPFDYLRLLWWLLIRPKTFKQYESGLDADGRDRLRRQGSWLTSSLTWLPLAFITVWPLLQTDQGTDSLATYYNYGLFGFIVLAWLLTGLWGHLDNDHLTINVVAVMAVFVAVGVAGGVADDVAGGMAGIVAVGLVGSVAGGLADIVTGNVARSVASSVAVGMGFIVAFIMAIFATVFVADSVAGGLVGIVAGIMAGIVAAIVTGIVTFIVAISVAVGVSSHY